MRSRLAALLLATTVLGCPALAHAEPGDELTVSVLTFGPGDHPFFKFGHNAIWVHDEALKRDRQVTEVLQQRAEEPLRRAAQLGKNVHGRRAAERLQRMSNRPQYERQAVQQRPVEVKNHGPRPYPPHGLTRTRRSGGGGGAGWASPDGWNSVAGKSRFSAAAVICRRVLSRVVSLR